MGIAYPTEWWDRYGLLDKLNKIKEIIDAINANTGKHPIVNCQIKPRGGATWYWLGPPWTILINTNDQVLEFRAGLPAGYTQFKVHLSYTGGNMTITSMVQWHSTVDVVWPENQAVNPFASPLTSFGWNEYSKTDSGWQDYNSEMQTMYGYIMRSGGTGAMYGIGAWAECR